MEGLEEIGKALKVDTFTEYIKQLGTTVGLKLLLGLVILIVGIWLSKKIVKLLGKGKGFGKLEPSVQSFIKSFVRVILLAVVIASACITWGVPSTSFMTIFTSAGVAIGLALQGALSNFAGGLMILFFKPFKVGDYIIGNGVEGTVKDITIIYTFLVTVDNKVITVPNGSLTNSTVTNCSKMPTRRVDLTISADYSNDIDLVEKTLIEVAQACPLALRDPAPMARLVAHNANSLDYTFRVWVNGADYWDAYFKLLEDVKKAFDEKGISIPFQQLDVCIKK